MIISTIASTSVHDDVGYDTSHTVNFLHIHYDETIYHRLLLPISFFLSCCKMNKTIISTRRFSFVKTTAHNTLERDILLSFNNCSVATSAISRGLLPLFPCMILSDGEMMFYLHTDRSVHKIIDDTKRTWHTMAWNKHTAWLLLISSNFFNNRSF